MHLSSLTIENFRIYGQGDQALQLNFNNGLNLLVGENNCGKSTIIDAIRLILGTRDEDFLRITTQDFHKPSPTEQATEFTIRAVFEDLDVEEAKPFLGYLQMVTENGKTRYRLHLRLHATRREDGEELGRFERQIHTELKAGPDVEGKPLEGDLRKVLEATYLKPLRDAERELAARKGSRLAQIFGAHKEIKDQKDAIEKIMADANTELNKLPVVEQRRDDLNIHYLSRLKLADDTFEARIGVAPMHLRGILERLALSITDGHLEDVCHGLGIDNLLFIAAEFLLLQGPKAPLRLALIEEPEAHLHPQLQLRLVEFLEQQLHSGGNTVQVILTSHSPHLASKVDLEHLILVQNKAAFSLARGETQLAPADYPFLKSFLDVTRANLFFARGVMIVEGPAEQHLLPALAEVLGRPFTHHGVSVVNVGGTGLFRYSRIFQRQNQGPKKPKIDIRVACVTDRDIPPAEAGKPAGKYKALVSDDLLQRTALSPEQKAEDLRLKHEEYGGDPVKLFVSPEWTLEYDLITAGLDREVFAAREIARKSKKNPLPEEEMLKIWNGVDDLMDKAKFALRKRHGSDFEPTEWQVEIYRPICNGDISKTDTAMYLAWILRLEHQKACGEGQVDAFREELKQRLPGYLVEAIWHVTRFVPAPAPVTA